jgi:hypothetical protein
MDINPYNWQSHRSGFGNSVEKHCQSAHTACRSRRGRRSRRKREERILDSEMLPRIIVASSFLPFTGFPSPAKRLRAGKELPAEVDAIVAVLCSVPRDSAIFSA